MHAPPDNADGSRGPGASIKLKREDWSASLTSSTCAGPYHLNVTIEIEPLAEFSTELTDYMHVHTKAGFVTPNSDPDAEPGQWLAIINDATANTSAYWEVTPKQPVGKQTYTFTIKDVLPNDRQTLILGLPARKRRSPDLERSHRLRQGALVGSALDDFKK